jgi:hypothetical protein
MGFAKFVSLISSNRLYFPRADKLEDPFEGVMPRRLQEALERHYSRHNIFDKRKGRRSFHDFYQQEIRPRNFLSCWHQNSVESAAMWAVYGKNQESVAVKTTIELLQHSLHNELENILLCKIEYCDDHSNWMPPSDMADRVPDDFLYPFLIKRKSFEHEKEIRAIVKRGTMEPITDAAGYEAIVDLHSLIEQVVHVGGEVYCLQIRA